jgi:protein-disulfide isomerase
MNRQRILLISALAVILLFGLGVYLYDRMEEDRLGELARQSNSVFNRPHSPTYGSAQAKVRIVEFFDPACETCRAFYPLVKNIVDSHPGKVQLVVRYTPLHAGADTAVKVLEAARLQGLFWPVNRTLLNAQQTWGADHNPRPDLIWSIVDGTGLNLKKAHEDATSPQVLANIDQDMADAKALNVTRTPGFFVNGKPLKDFGEEQLKALVSRELKAAYPQ